MTPPGGTEIFFVHLPAHGLHPNGGQQSESELQMKPGGLQFGN